MYLAGSFFTQTIHENRCDLFYPSPVFIFWYYLHRIHFAWLFGASPRLFSLSVLIQNDNDENEVRTTIDYNVFVSGAWRRASEGCCSGENTAIKSHQFTVGLKFRRVLELVEIEYLTTELIGWEGSHFQPLWFVLIQKFFQLDVVGLSQSAFRSDIHNDHDLSSEISFLIGWKQPGKQLGEPTCTSRRKRPFRLSP